MRFIRSVALLAFMGFVVGAPVGLAVREAYANRNSSGTYSLPAGNPAIPNTLITSSQWNSNFSDLGNELSDSLSRSGKGGMQAALRGLDGSTSAPAYSYTSETNSGEYRKAAGNICMSVANADVACYASTGLTVTGTVAASVNVTGVDFIASGKVTAATPSTFTGSAAHAPITLTPLAAPSTPSNGELWVDTGTNSVRARINGATKDLVTTDSIAVAAVASMWLDGGAVALTVTATDTKFNSFANPKTVGSMTNDGTGKITATNTATYRIFVAMSINTSSIAGSSFSLNGLKIRKNGSAFVTLGARSVVLANAIEGTGVSGEIVTDLTAGDFIEVYYNASGGGAGNALVQQAQFTVQRVS